MHILLGATTDLIRVTTGSAADVEATVDYVEYNTAAPPVVQSLTDVVNASITTAATTTLLAGAASARRVIKSIHLFNRSATSTTVLVEHNNNTDQNGMAFCTLLQNEVLLYTESGMWVHYDANMTPYTQSIKLDAKLRVTADVINATTSFADVTGLTVALKSGKNYAFEAHLISLNNAATTGSQFAVNIGAAPTTLAISNVSVSTPGATSAVMAGGGATARDTASSADTAGGTTAHLNIMSGFITPSADGTFAIRCASEIAVAAGITVKAGSWLRIWETDN